MLSKSSFAISIPCGRWLWPGASLSIGKILVYESNPWLYGLRYILGIVEVETTREREATLPTNATKTPARKGATEKLESIVLAPLPREFHEPVLHLLNAVFSCANGSLKQGLVRSPGPP